MSTPSSSRNAERTEVRAPAGAEREMTPIISAGLVKMITYSSHRFLALYAACGLVIGFGFLPLIPLVRFLGFPRDTSVGIALFGLMPLLVVGAGLSYPRLSLNLLGLGLAILTWALGYTAASLLMGFTLSSVGYSLVIMAPLVVPGYVVLGLLVCLLVNLRRRSRRIRTMACDTSRRGRQ